MDLYRRTVLVVEDEPLIRMLLADALEDDGYPVFEVGNVLEAIAALGHQRIDLVVTDIDMPGGLSGLDLMEFLASSQKETPVVVTTGGRSVDDLTLPRNARFIAKPYQLDDMLQLLAKCTATMDAAPGTHAA
jgi:DNA-binding NtrC family response regulator